MNAGFGWIDFSNAQRQKVFSVIDLLSEGGTVDELGIGSIRDAIADWLFPGISTIQTRPKYFIILTDILKEYIRQHNEGKKIIRLDDFFKKEEHRIMNILAKNHGYRDGDGVIGVNVAQNNGELARRASSIYWNGMRIHRLINTDLSSNDYFKQNDLSNLPKERIMNESGGDDVVMLDDQFEIRAPYFKCITDKMTLKLTKQEANFLRDQFMDNTHPLKKENNLLGQLMTPEIANILNASSSFKHLAQALITHPKIHEETKNILRMALDFDFIIHGAHIRYNIQLHKKSGVCDFSQEWKEWLESLRKKRNEIEGFDFDFLFGEIAPKTTSSTQFFLRNWRDGVLKTKLDLDNLDEIVRYQEIKKKGAKAKLTSVDGEFSEWVGIRELNYRFGTVKNMVIDIQLAHA
jgi:hypothetical protein